MDIRQNLAGDVVKNMTIEGLPTETESETGKVMHNTSGAKGSRSLRKPPPAKIRVDNLHYDLTEEDLYV